MNKDLEEKIIDDAAKIAFERGEIFWRDAHEEFNRIEIQIEQQKQYFKDVEDDKRNFLPLFEHGLFICNQPNDRLTGFILWDSHIETDKVFLHVRCDQKNFNTPVFELFECDIEMPLIIEGNNLDIHISNAFIPIVEAFDAEWLGDEAHEIGDDFVNGKMKSILHIWFMTTAWINFLIENPDYKKTKIIDEKNIDLNGIPIKTSEESVHKLAKKERQKICSLWAVSGHFRHYKNGRVIYIKPYLKGENRHLKDEKE